MRVKIYLINIFFAVIVLGLCLLFGYAGYRDGQRMKWVARCVVAHSTLPQPEAFCESYFMVHRRDTNGLWDVPDQPE